MHNFLRYLIITLLVVTPPAFAANYAYMDDADTRLPANDTRLPNISRHTFPRTIMAETQSLAGNVEQYSKYDVITTSGGIINKVANLQSKYPDLMYFRQLMAAEYLGYTDEAENIYCAQGHGLPFQKTGSKSGSCTVYAGHWLYQAGTTLRNSISTTTTTVSVVNASRFSNGDYVVIYNAPAGSFNNAEHAKIIGRNTSNNTLTLQRGYKSSALSHPGGSIIAQHVTGQGGSTKNWSFNMSNQCPKDANGKTYAQVMLDFIANNYNKDRTGKTISHIKVSGFLFDSDFHFLFKFKKADTNNDLATDNGTSNSGTNWWGIGLDNFYTAVKNRFPNKYVIGGHHLARGFHANNGAQMEGWPVDKNYHSENPSYNLINSRLSTYGYYNHYVNKGPAHSHVLTKTPTRIYPDGTAANTNAPFRLTLGTGLLEDGYIGTQNSKTHTDPWYDEYAVNVVSGSSNYGQAIRSNKSDESAIRRHRGWLGKALGNRTRIENSNFAPASSLITPGTFDTNLNGWSGKNVTLSRSTSGTRDGAGALRASTQAKYDEQLFDSQIKGPTVSLNKGSWYTLVFSAKASASREIKVNVGNFGERFPLATQWRRYVMSFKAVGNSNQLISFSVGRENTVVNLDSVYLFNGNANVFRRDFDNGIVVVNATADTTTVNLNGTFQRIKGFQDTAINNGASLNSVTIQPWDAAILVRPDNGSGGNGSGSGGNGGGTGTVALNAAVLANNRTVSKPGPTITTGSSINWKYTVSNTGNVTLNNVSVKSRQKLPSTGNWKTLCTIASIPAGGNATCTSSSVAIEGIFKSLVVLSGTASGKTVDALVDAFYTGKKNGAGSSTPNPLLGLAIFANNKSAVKPGPALNSGSTVNWHYTVSNAGNTTLTNVAVKGRRKLPTTGNWKTLCTISSIGVGQSKSCTEQGTVVRGTYKSLITVETKNLQLSKDAFYVGK